MNTWRLISFQRLSGFENMALDEALFREVLHREGAPTLRLYGWSRPSLTIGYAQKLDREVNRRYCRDQGIDIIRRPTGGKAVYHSTDLTYALVASQLREPFSVNILETYRVISDCLVRGLEKAGITACLVEGGRQGIHAASGGSCFAVPFQNELLVGDAKICGSAQLRARNCFLQHGSILMDFEPGDTVRATLGDGGNEEERIRRLGDGVTSVGRESGRSLSAEDLAPFIVQGFEESLQIKLVEDVLTGREQDLKDRLVEEKYGTLRWNEEGGL